LKVLDSAAGKRVKCPGCGNALKLPKKKEPVAEAGDDEFDLQSFSEKDAYGGEVEEPQMPCPACGETIAAKASKCTYCGEILDEDLKRKERKKQRSRSVHDEDSDLSVLEWVVCILCSNIGCIAGIVYMIQGKPKGWKMFVISLVVNVIAFVVGFVGALIQMSMKHG
jgi:hypothetical protein